jgi:condensin complex subunit 3
LLNWLFQGFSAKNKTTRYRSVIIVSELIAHLGELEQVLFLYYVFPGLLLNLQ